MPRISLTLLVLFLLSDEIRHRGTRRRWSCRHENRRPRYPAVRFHPELLALSGQLCVALRLCGVRKPQQKGKVERAIRYLRERFFAARTIRDLDQGNAELGRGTATISPAELPFIWAVCPAIISAR